MCWGNEIANWCQRVWKLVSKDLRSESNSLLILMLSKFEASWSAVIVIAATDKVRLVVVFKCAERLPNVFHVISNVVVASMLSYFSTPFSKASNFCRKWAGPFHYTVRQCDSRISSFRIALYLSLGDQYFLFTALCPVTFRVSHISVKFIWKHACKMSKNSYFSGMKRKGGASSAEVIGAFVFVICIQFCLSLPGAAVELCERDAS